MLGKPILAFTILLFFFSCAKKPSPAEILQLENTRLSTKQAQVEIEKLQRKIDQIDSDILANEEVLKSLQDEKKQLIQNMTLRNP